DRSHVLRDPGPRRRERGPAAATAPGRGAAPLGMADHHLVPAGDHRDRRGVPAPVAGDARHQLNAAASADHPRPERQSISSAPGIAREICGMNTTTNRTLPTGGVTTPAEKAYTTMVPKWMGWTPISDTIGAKIGTKIRMAGVAST